MCIISEIKLAFGLKNGKIIHIDELSEKERGLSCNCVCPCCGAPLQAKMGSKNRHHFSHTSENCSSETAIQSALHLLAKEIITQKGGLLFPSIDLEYKNSSYFSYEYSQSLPKCIEIKPKRYIECDNIFLERKLSSIVPDIIFVAKENSCIIEIAVTHFVDKIKKEKIRKLGLPAIEIDLSNIYKKDLKIEEIENEIINSESNKKWIYYPNFENLIQKAELKYKKAIDEIEYKKQEAEKERKKQAEARKAQREQYYKSKLEQYRSDIKTNNVIKGLHFYKDIKDGFIPYFLDIPIDGEIVFECDRRIWQAALFDKFIYYRNLTNNGTVSIYNICQWIRKHQSLFKLDWYAIKNDFGDTYRIIEQYLTYMHFLGFISELYRQEADILNTHTLIPPKQEHANLLYVAISSIDSCLQNPNGKIEQYLAETYGVFLSSKKGFEFRIGQSYKSEF